MLRRQSRHIYKSKYKELGILSIVTLLSNYTKIYRPFPTTLQNTANHQTKMQTFSNTTLQRYTNHYINIQTFLYNATNHYIYIQTFLYNGTERYKPLHRHTDLFIQRYTERYKPLHLYTGGKCVVFCLPGIY